MKICLKVSRKLSQQNGRIQTYGHSLLKFLAEYFECDDALFEFECVDIFAEVLSDADSHPLHKGQHPSHFFSVIFGSLEEEEKGACMRRMKRN